MGIQKNFKTVLPLLLALALMSFPASYALAQESYSFKVHNVGKDKILKLMASEDGKDWGYFDIGDGINPGETVTVVWDESTNSQSCSQYIKAAFDDGLESPPKKLDFCEKNLSINVR